MGSHVKGKAINARRISSYVHQPGYKDEIRNLPSAQQLPEKVSTHTLATLRDTCSLVLDPRET